MQEKAFPTSLPFSLLFGLGTLKNLYCWFFWFQLSLGTSVSFNESFKYKPVLPRDGLGTIIQHRFLEAWCVYNHPEVFFLQMAKIKWRIGWKSKPTSEEDSCLTAYKHLYREFEILADFKSYLSLLFWLAIWEHLNYFYDAIRVAIWAYCKTLSKMMWAEL